MFKRSAEKLVAVLMELAPDVQVTINSERVRSAGRQRAPVPHARLQPRKGYFEVTIKVYLRVYTAITTAGYPQPLLFFQPQGKAVVSLPSMPRPFKKLRELDLHEAAQAVVAARQ